MRRMSVAAESMTQPGPEPDAPPPESEEVFVRAVDLPTASETKARAAVALQLDILSPLPAGETVSSMVLLGPVEGGLTRFAVGMAPRSLFASHAAAGGRGPVAIRLAGRLDGQLISFRFENPHRAEARTKAAQGRLSTLVVVGACIAVLLAGLSLRLQREIDAAQAQADATDTAVHQALQSGRAGGEDVAGWLSARAGNAALVECALLKAAAAGGDGGPVDLSDLSIGDGAAIITFAGAASGAPSTDPAPADAATPGQAPGPTPRQIRIKAADCR